MKTLFMTILLWLLLLLPAQAGDLHKAAAKGDIEKVKEFVTSHPEAINEMDSSGFQPLIYSCAKGSCEVTEYLISKGAGVNERAEGGLTPLHIAAYYKQKDIIKLLVSKGARIDAKENFGLTPMMSTDDMEIKKLLCSLDTGKGADPASLDNGYIIWLASNWFNISVGKEDGIEMGDEIDVARKGSVVARGKVIALQKSTARASVTEGSLKGISSGCHIQVVGKEKIIDSIIKGRLLSMPRFTKSYNQSHTETPTDISDLEAKEFFNAIMANDSKTVNRYLVTKPDIVKIRDSNFRTPLHYAVQYQKDKEIAISLIISGANVNAIDRKKSTPLHLAALYGRTDVMEMLVSKKADVNARDIDNKSPMDYAKSVGDSKAVKILMQNGAREK